jgi:hypothetical protein
LRPRCEVFLGSMGSLTSPCGSASGLSLVVSGFACPPAYALTPGQPPPGTATLLRHPTSLPTARSVRDFRRSPRRGHGFRRLAFPGSARAVSRGYGNINPLSIDYACRPRLRPRLTLGGLACPRNPWSSGGGVSRSSFATHACILTRDASTAGFPRRFTRDATLPYPSTQSVNATASAACLSPVTLSARNHLTSELLRTLSRVAASKPTSWLSSRLHILSHLACA